MKYIDLHVHSNASDGTLSPSELVTLAVSKNLEAFALTDHDTVKGVGEAIETAAKFTGENSITVISGIELSAAYKKKDIHILGLMVDYKNPEFCHQLENVLEEREQRNYKMIANLAKSGIDISMEKLRASEGNAVLTRAHFAKYLTEHHYTTSVQNAFVHYLNENGPYYVSRNYMTPEEAIQLILKADGIPVLAHPLLYRLSDDELDTLIQLLAQNGLAGLEAMYSSYTGYDEQHIKKLAKKYHLLITGGSDFHGVNKPNIMIGTGRGNLKIPYSLLQSLKNWKTQH